MYYYLFDFVTHTHTHTQPPPRLPPSRKLAPPTSIVHPSNQSGILTPTTMMSRHQQQTTPSSVGMVTVPYTSLDCTPMECSSSHFSMRNKLPTPGKKINTAMFVVIEILSMQTALESVLHRLRQPFPVL